MGGGPTSEEGMGMGSMSMGGGRSEEERTDDGMGMGTGHGSLPWVPRYCHGGMGLDLAGPWTGKGMRVGWALFCRWGVSREETEPEKAQTEERLE